MNILLVNPPFKAKFGKFSREQRSPAITKSGTLYYPMWLAYATGVLEQAGHDCRLVDAAAEGLDFIGVCQKIKDFTPGLIVVDTSTPSIYDDVEFAVRMKERYKGFTVLVGTHPSALAGQTLEIHPKIDAVCRREYEHTLLELAVVLQNNVQLTDELLKQIKGLSFRRQQETIHNPDRQLFAELDQLPFVSEVYKKHLNFRNYFYGHSKFPLVTIISGRGCPYQCSYCVYPQVFNGHKLRYRSINNVLDEVEYILKEFSGVKEIMFEDDTLTLDKKRCLEFAQQIKKRGLRFTWSANSRVEVDLETLKALKQSGCRLLCVGVESGRQEILDQIKKNTTIGLIQQFFTNARKAKIMVHGCFLLGGPGETKKTMEETLAFAKKLNPDTAQFFPIMVYPGTQAYKWANDNGYLKTTDFRKWVTSQGLHNCVVSRPNLSNIELVRFCDLARREFYLRFKYISAKLCNGFRDFQEFKRLSRGAWNLFSRMGKKQ